MVLIRWPHMELSSLSVTRYSVVLWLVFDDNKLILLVISVNIDNFFLGPNDHSFRTSSLALNLNDFNNPARSWPDFICEDDGFDARWNTLILRPQGKFSMSICNVPFDAITLPMNSEALSPTNSVRLLTGGDVHDPCYINLIEIVCPGNFGNLLMYRFSPY